MTHSIKPLKNGIIRISQREKSISYLERYGIINIPTEEGAEGIEISESKITLPNGNVVEFSVRNDDSFWVEEEKYLIEKYKSTKPRGFNIEGRPDQRSEWKEVDFDGRNSENKFGISFKIDSDEKFYGLGEASRDKIQLRGASYQNFAVYKFDEIVIPLVYSNKNWGIFIAADGRHFVDIDDNAKNRLTILGNFDELDVYLLYGDSMKDIIKLYTDISGKSMLFPKWAYGLTYIAQIHQNQFEILDDMTKFRNKHIPCDTVSLEPGWMSKHYDYSFEKTWNLQKFHIERWMYNRSYEGNFFGAMRRLNLHVALWFCMNYDLSDLEEAAITGEQQKPAWYDHVKKFVDCGADGMKIDPADMLGGVAPHEVCSNGKTQYEMQNINQVLVMKQMNKGYSKQMNQRPFIHFCGGYTGQQKWGGATTGDNGGGVGSMIWLEGLSMSGFMNSTVDMDVFSIPSIHFAMLAPWAHHNAWSGVRQPWYAGAENEAAYTYYANLRYSLIPYIYSAAIECHETGVHMIRPMPLEFQGDENCDELIHQFMLGSNILLSAFTDTVYLPQGEWIDFWTGECYNGGQTLLYQPPKGRGGAFFIKAGAIIPKWKARDFVNQYDDQEIELHIYPMGNSEYVFREDDGESLEEKSCHTRIVCRETEKQIEITVGKRVGEYQNKPTSRTYFVYVHGTEKSVSCTCKDENDKIILVE